MDKGEIQKHEHDEMNGIARECAKSLIIGDFQLATAQEGQNYWYCLFGQLQINAIELRKTFQAGRHLSKLQWRALDLRSALPRN